MNKFSISLRKFILLGYGAFVDRFATNTPGDTILLDRVKNQFFTQDLIRIEGKRVLNQIQAH